MMLMSLPRMIPIVARHALDYVDLAAVDTRFAAREVGRRFVAMAIAAVAGSLALLMSCVLVIALTWDGPYRVLAVGLLLGLFLVATLASCLVLQRGAANNGLFFRNVREAWTKDQECLRESLKDVDDEPERTTEEIIHGVDPKRYAGGTR